MRLEDVLLCLAVNLDSLAGVNPVEFCRDAIDGGADLILLSGSLVSGAEEAHLRPLLEACRRADALVVIEDDAVLATSLGADGVHLTDSEGDLGIARAVIGMQHIVGVTTGRRDEVILAQELGVDYLIHQAGIDCVGVFRGLLGLANAPMFAGGISGPAEAARMVEAGMLRLCLDAASLPASAVREEIAEYSRLLGRCI